MQAEIAKLRREAAAARTKSRDEARAEAAEAAKADLLATLTKALGGAGDEPPSEEAVAAQLTAARQAQRTAAVELAVYRGADQHGGNPAALTDSRTFLAEVSTLDPAGSDFLAKVTEAAKNAVKANPALRTPLVGGPSTVDAGSGSPRRTSTGPVSLMDAVTRAYTPRS